MNGGRVLFNAISPITLGTVQMGLSYGISNTGGMLKEAQCFEVLDYAQLRGITCLDTASAYGKSESVIGAYVQRNPDHIFHIITKLPSLPPAIAETAIEQFLIEAFETSLERLRSNSIFGLLVHNAQDYFENRKIYDSVMYKFQKENVIKYFGLSTYDWNDISPDENFDYYQAPVNIFDNILVRQDTALKLRKHGKYLFVRSVFLQGLFFLSNTELAVKLPTARPFVEEVRKYSKYFAIPINMLCLGFVFHHLKDTGSIVLGVDSIDQLEENCQIYSYYEEYAEKFEEFSQILMNTNEDIPEKIIRPFLW